MDPDASIPASQEQRSLQITRPNERVSGSPPQELRDALRARLVGKSRPMRVLRQRLEGLAPLWVPVLLEGEPGSGRATAAELLHAFGPAARGELVRIPAAAFTAERRLPALGTVYLEGVERLDPGTQAWWLSRLRAQPVGAGGGVRWLASTDDAALARGAPPGFDTDLARLLARFAVRLPPLRERPGDIPLLVTGMCARLGSAVGRERIRLSPQALEVLASSHWPGNLRELEEVAGRAVAFSTTPVIGRSLVSDVLAEREESLRGLREERARGERETLLALLRSTGGNVARTAEALGRSRAAVYRLIARHRIPLSWERRRKGRPGRRPPGG